jgi:hypothetical protein
VDRIALLYLVSSLELLHPLCGVYDAPLSGEEGVTLAAKLYLEHRLGRTDSEAVAAGAGDLRFHVFRMDILLHLTLMESVRLHNHHRFAALNRVAALPRAERRIPAPLPLTPRHHLYQHAL